MEDLPSSASPYCQAVGLCAALKYGIMKMTGALATIPMIGGGRAEDPATAEKALEEKQCDFIFLGHSLLPQPDLVKLIDEEREDEIRPCIGCGECIDSQLQEGATCCCSGNAVLGQGNNDYKIPPAETMKHVVVIGGGVAGVEAARIAAKRGHHVALYEKTGRIGGQMHYAVKPPHKQNMELLIPYLERQLELTGVAVHLNTAVTAEDVLALKPDAVVCASGVRPAVLPVPGAEHAIQSKEALDGAKTGAKVVIIGGGSVGLETAELLASEGRQVTVLEMMDTVAEKMVNVTRTIVLGHLKAYGTQILTSCRCQEIREDSILYQDKDGNSHELPADTVIIATGDRPDPSLYEALEEKVPELYNVGDSNGAGIIANAVSQGYRCGLQI